MNESMIRRRLRDAIGESAYPPHLTGRLAESLSRPAERPRIDTRMLALVAAMLAIALVVTILFGGQVLRPRSSVPVMPPVTPPVVQPSSPGGCPSFTTGIGGLNFIHMTSSTVGWAQGGLRTNDGGAHWTRVAPAAMFSGMPASAIADHLYPPGFSEFYLDDNHGWLVRRYARSAVCMDHATVIATTDGGRSWRRSQDIALDAQPSWDGHLMLQFIDPFHGWLSVSFAQTIDVGSPVARDLYATSDGGLHWHRVFRHTASSPGVPAVARCDFAGGDVLFFVTATKAWMGSQCGLPALSFYESVDGGASWKLKQLPTSSDTICPCTALPVAILDADHALFEVDNPSPTPSSYLLSTADGGNSWEVLPARPAGGGRQGFDYMSSSTWWLLAAQPGWKNSQPARDWLYRTIDGGHSWTLVQTDLPLGTGGVYLKFFDADHGMAVQAQNATTGGPPSQNLEILTTSDGGHTWTVAVPKVSVSY